MIRSGSLASTRTLLRRRFVKPDVTSPRNIILMQEEIPT